ncbi:MAG: ferredoxin [Acetobacteraceae bacterium]|nr:ferredoxin [Acetobacteraceae bacterium]
MFVILTSKPGQFRTEIVDGITPVEAWDYHFAGARRARFVIADLAGETKVRVIDEAPPPMVNLVPTKFLPKFETVEAARAELAHLTRFGGADTALRPAPLQA